MHAGNIVARTMVAYLQIQYLANPGHRQQLSASGGTSEPPQLHSALVQRQLYTSQWLHQASLVGSYPGLTLHEPVIG